MFKGKKILVGVTGGIAAYKCADLVREYIKASADVRVMMTEAATHFVGPLTFETLSQNDVLIDLFPHGGGLATAHIDWARWPDVIVICPATANTIAKVAAGMADNALTTTVLATTVPVLFCPAMNKEMYANTIYQANQQKLKELGYHFVAPGTGDLACGEQGWGRLAEKDDIFFATQKILLATGEFSGKNILVTAGPTHEPIDPVRYISNRSSGKMGYAIAQKAHLRGGNVTLVSGPTHLRPPRGVHLVSVETALQMANAIYDLLEQMDILIMAAAVSDFRAKSVSQNKIKKSSQFTSIELEENPDILAHVRSKKGTRIHVGFALETDEEIKNAREKLKRKGLDLIVINNPLEAGAGFEVDTNKVKIMNRDGVVEEIEMMTKAELADRILDRIHALLS